MVTVELSTFGYRGQQVAALRVRNGHGISAGGASWVVGRALRDLQREHPDATLAGCDLETWARGLPAALRGGPITASVTFDQRGI